MQGVVPAAGRGTRMGSLTDDRPKGLVEVAGKPLLTHCFEELLELGVGEIVVVVGYRGEQIRDHYGDAFRGVPVTYARQEDPQGLADAVRRAGEYVEGEFALLHGDNVFGTDLSRVLDRHRDRDPAATLLVEDVSREEARDEGVCVFEDGDLVDVVEKPDDPPSTLTTRGFAVHGQATIAACSRIDPSERGEYELADAIGLLLAEGRRVETVRADGWVANVNAPADVARVERLLADG